jgi:hypothetical protein
MSGMLRFASSAVALFFRLVIVVSLAGYSLSTVNAAMHPDLPGKAMLVEMDHSTTHDSDHAATADMDHGGDQHDHADSKSSKNTCCQDYCGVAAIDCGGLALTHPRVELVHALLDDAHYVGLAPSLHLPPNI